MVNKAIVRRQESVKDGERKRERKNGEERTRDCTREKGRENEIEHVGER